MDLGGIGSGKEPTEETREKADPRDEKDEVIRNNFGYFREKHPEIYDAYERFGRLPGP